MIMAEETNETPAAPEVFRLKFLMRSGNFFMIDGVLDWSMRHLEGRTIGLTLKQSTDPRYARVVVDSIDLSQIEAVVLLPDDQARRLAVLGDPDGRPQKGARP